MQKESVRLYYYEINPKPFHEGFIFGGVLWGINFLSSGQFNWRTGANWSLFNACLGVSG